MNLMNAIPKPFFVKDVCPGSDQNMNYMSDSIPFIYLCTYSFIHSACTQPYHSPRLHARRHGVYFQVNKTQPLPSTSSSSSEIGDPSNLTRVQDAVKQVQRKRPEEGRS